MRRTKFFIIGFFVIVILVFFVDFKFFSFNDHSYVVTVTDKDRIVKSNGNNTQSYYIVFTKDDNGDYHEFKNEDSLIRLKFNSSNVQNKLEIGKKYKLTVIGYRIPILSCYENIIEIEEIE